MITETGISCPCDAEPLVVDMSARQLPHVVGSGKVMVKLNIESIVCPSCGCDWSQE